MRTLLLGLAYLLGTMVPTGTAVVGLLGLHRLAREGGGAAALLQLAVYGVTYGLAYGVVAVVVRRFGLEHRVASRIPGRWLIGSGLSIAGTYMVLRALGATVQGGGATFALVLMSPLFLLPSLALVMVGVARGLWAVCRGTPRTAKP